MFAVDERGFGPTHDSAGALNLFDQFADKKACMTKVSCEKTHSSHHGLDEFMEPIRKGRR